MCDMVVSSGCAAWQTIWHFRCFATFKFLLSMPYFHTPQFVAPAKPLHSDLEESARRKNKEMRVCRSQTALWNYFCILTYLLKSLLFSREKSLAVVFIVSLVSPKTYSNYRKYLFLRNYVCSLSKTM